MLVLLDVNPVLAGFGQLAAIIICLFALIFIVIAVQGAKKFRRRDSSVSSAICPRPESG